jgi:hypothetical protein
MKLTAFAFAFAFAAVAASQAHAGITCNLTDQKGNTLTYSFDRGGSGYADEVRVARNGSTVSNGGVTWSRTTDRDAKSETLWQGDGWSIAYPWDVTKSRAALRHNGNLVAAGVCDVDNSIDTPQAPVEANAPSAPQPAPTSTEEAAPGSLSAYLGM